MGGILGLGVEPCVGGAAWGLLEKPIAMIIALADRVGEVLREEERVAQAPAPQPEISAAALKKFTAGAIGKPDFPHLPAITDGLPFDLAEIECLAGFDGDIGSGELAEHAVS